MNNAKKNKIKVKSLTVGNFLNNITFSNMILEGIGCKSSLSFENHIDK